jgi:integrase/recombinase XerC
VATENTKLRRPPGAPTTTENTTTPVGRRRGRAAIALSAAYIEVLDGYAAALRTAPLSEQSRRTYASKVRQFLAWLAAADLGLRPQVCKIQR